ncbi:class I SAM-dependent methyltransferase [Haladaptatus sp. GCM10025893]|uniref:class I SAM-dependent methyltransferase n=1 Tax=Haladaptatus sp. GCM10025893 TaxID=3252659 RepID=UPI003610A239
MRGANSKRDVATSFGRASTGYRDSPVHRGGRDLQLLSEWANEATLALDVATGSGHTGNALMRAGVDEVIVVDLTPEMVALAQSSFPLLRGVVGDAEGLPFPDDTFDAVSCRIAAHHFPDPATFVAEVARVLDPGGVFVLEDNVAPDDEVLAEFLNRVERLRDPTHVESYSEQRWRDWLDDAGFVVEETAWVRRTLEFDSWVERIGVPQAWLDELQAEFDKAPNAARRYFDIWYAEDGVASFTTPKLLVRARA